MDELYGVSRRKVLSDLIDRFDATRMDERPRLVALEAPMGWGKTCIVRAFYRELARTRQGEPSYWPSEMTPRGGSWTDDRKLVFPKSFEIPDSAQMDWFWWGLSCQVEQWGGLLDAFASPTAAAQFEHHVGHLIARIGARRRGARIGLDMAQVIAGLLPLPDVIGLATSAKDLGKETRALIGEAKDLREARKGPRRTVDLNAEVPAQVIDHLGQALSLLSGPDLPIVVVLDDAHWANEGTVRVIERALQTKGSLLVVATLWPPSERGDTPFGRWMHRSAEREPDIVEVVSLERMGTEDLSALVTQGAPATDPAVVRRFTEAADGNPLVLKGYLEIGSVKDTLVDGHYDLDPNDDLFNDLPRSVEALYTRLWEDLPDEVQKLLSLATVGGMRFVTDWLVQTASDLLALEHSATLLRSEGGWVGVLDDALASFGERSRYLAALDAAPEELGRRRSSAAHRLLEYIDALRSLGSWNALPSIVREVLLDGHLVAARTKLVPVTISSVRDALELANLVAGRRDPGRAVTIGRQALAWRELVAGVGPPTLSETRAEVAGWMIGAGAFDAATDLLWQVLDAEPGDSPLSLQTWRSLGAALGEAGRFDEGIVAYDNVLELAVANGSQPDDPTLLLVRERIANYLGRAGRVSAALERYEELLEAAGGAGLSADTVTEFEANYAHLLGRSGRYEESVAVHTRVIAAMRDRRPEDDLVLLRAEANLAHRLSEADRVLESITLHEHIIGVRHRVLGPRHPATLIARANLAHWGIGACGELDAAVNSHRVVLGDMRRVLADEHPAALRTSSRLAFWLAMAGDPAKAHQEYEATIALMSGTLVGDHPELVEARYNAGVLDLHDGFASGARNQLGRAFRDWSGMTDPPDERLLTAALTVEGTASMDPSDALVSMSEVVRSCRSQRIRPPRVSGFLELVQKT